MKHYFLFFICFFILSCSDEDRVESDLILTDDNFQIKINTAVQLPIFSNDTGITPNSQLSLATNLTEKGGEISLTSNKVLYKPAQNFIGIDTFRYQIVEFGIIHSATVNIEVQKAGVESSFLSSKHFVAGEDLSLDITFDSIVYDLSEENVKFYLDHEIMSSLLDITHGENKTTLKLTFKFPENHDFIRKQSGEVNVNFPVYIESKVTENYLYYSRPRMAQLNWPQRSLFKNEQSLDAASRNSIDFYWLNLGEWHVPEQLNWQENPFNNISWVMFFNSLGWLTSYGELYLQTTEQHYLDLIEKHIISYNKRFSAEHDLTNELSYREDAVSLRVNHLLYIYLNLRQHLSQPAITALEELISKDIRMLSVYVADPQYDDDNHGLIQAKSALNLYAVFPYKPELEHVLEKASLRVEKASGYMFDSISGQNIEQSPEYHYVGVSMLLEAMAQFKSLDIEVPAVLEKTLINAVTHGMYFLYNNGEIPAIGDSYSDKYWEYFVKRYYEILNVPIDEFEQFLVYGQKALSDLRVSPQERLVIAKSDSSNEKFTKVFFDAGPKRVVHGHFDNMNLVGMLDGHKLLVDSGGPYNYTGKGRQYFWNASAHNIVTINGFEQNEVDAELHFYEDKNEFLQFSGTQPSRNSALHTRAVLLPKESENAIIVVDLASANSSSNLFKEYWHFPASSRLRLLNQDTSEIVLDNGKKYLNLSYGNNELCEVVEGQYDRNGIPKLGWVTRKYNDATAAPVKVCESTSNTYFKLNIFISEDAFQSFQVLEKNADYLAFELNSKKYNFSKQQARFNVL
ncbi:heparinase II/III domain-containing protein [Pseudoalteromonas spongiae]|uniref:heparinase II/III domain-containing protein n=1 Tax=Pseudoalteromonas spongiae TaxID=298657 RepID=UPI00030BD024|nr:heparinase II/III family protein [Pseudoalteromonas spongiae]